MKKSRFLEPQIIKIQSEQEQGKSASDICRTHGIRSTNFLQLEEYIFRNECEPTQKVEGTQIKIKFI